MVKITRKWINELSGFALTDDQIDETLTMHGLEVEERISTIPDLTGVVVGEVVKTEKVKDSDHLNCCQVNIGAEQLQIVCGAPNVAAGQKVPVATIGTILPGGFKIKKAKLRGIASSGMICSERELSLSQEADGIMVLPGESRIGAAINDLIDESDTVFDIFITPNRPDCLGAIGIARELCIDAGKPFKSPLEKVPVKNKSSELPLSIEIKNPEACPRYTGIVLKNVTVGPSPDWLVNRLEHLGLRSISNIVDVTNLIMLETGQPLHAFDYDKIQGAKIIVRNANNGEKFVTLDEQERNLTSDDLLICDGEKPVAIAGVMGGLGSEVMATTKNVLLEVANFDPTITRRTSSRLNLSTDASKRFERGVDPNIPAKVSQRAVDLMLELGGGKIASDFIDVYPRKIEAPTIQLRSNQLNKIIGKKFTDSEIVGYLEALECKVTKCKSFFDVVPPTFRPDLFREIDLIEEIARLFGYNEIEDQLDNSINVLNQKNSYFNFIELVKNTLGSFGLMESITISMAPVKSCKPFVENDDSLARIINPLSEDMAVLRPTISSTLLSSIAYNLNRKNSDVRLFEVGSTFIQDGKNLKENFRVEGLLAGNAQPKSWHTPSPEPLSAFTIKGIIQKLLSTLRIENIKQLDASPAWYSFGSTLIHKKREVGHFGLISKSVLKEFDVEQDVLAFCLDLEYLFSIYTSDKKYVEISRFPAIDRDIALVVDKTIPAQAILETIENTSGKLLRKLLLFDVYEGKGITKGKKSLAFSLEFQSPDRTLKETEINQLMDKILSTLNKKYSAELRQ
ncbi:MAG: phenylalanine--tRNA ligase subunit beta [Calditrichaeota bacterium]|nr:MAG: phenylalanine--tRNA ligase subunit beta [Calditrichota bacterium]